MCEFNQRRSALQKVRTHLSSPEERSSYKTLATLSFFVIFHPFSLLSFAKTKLT